MPVTTLPFSTMSDDEVAVCLRKHRIGLTVDEARTVEKMLGRAPTLTEATIWGIQGSEHCSYKSSRRFLKQFVTDSSHVILGPKEDSGIVAITNGPKGKRWGIVVSHESHNHPSQIVPYEGAATGVGGCVRDVLCMGARVIGAMDNLRLGDLKTDESRAIASEVIRGVAGYGNALGIPNLGGDTVFDAAYNRNCLVNVVTFGLIQEDEIIHSYVQKEAAKAGYDIIIVGKATDRSGFGGASFASGTMKEEERESNTGAVQEPNPFLERHLLASTYALFDTIIKDKHLDKVSFKDLGAGGVVCASVEQVAPLKMGAKIDLENVHRAIIDLPPEVIGCAETQERFCWICHPSLTQSILKHYNETWDLPSVGEGARASVIGAVTDDGIYTLTYKGEVVCSASSEDMTSGLQYVRPTRAPARIFSEPSISYADAKISVLDQSFGIQDIFLGMLQHPTHASRSPVFRHYDKNIIGNTVVEPGEGDAGVIMPLEDIQAYASEVGHDAWHVTDADRYIGVALAAGGNGRYGRISPYLQGVNAVVENVRNVASTGALPRAITDCLNYGSPEVPEQLWALEEGVRGIAEAAKGIAVEGEAIPVISGNVSLYNDTEDGPIDPTAIVCCVGVMPDARKSVSMQLKNAGSALYLIGERKDECGGSAYYDVLESLTKSKQNALLGKHVPNPDFKDVLHQISFMHAAISDGLISASHDISEGGLLLALFEMTVPQRKRGGVTGFAINIADVASDLRPDAVLFSETGGFVIEVSKETEKKILALAKEHKISMMKIGETTQKPMISVHSGRDSLVNVSLKEAHHQWETGLTRILSNL